MAPNVAENLPGSGHFPVPVRQAACRSTSPEDAERSAKPCVRRGNKLASRAQSLSLRAPFYIARVYARTNHR